MDPREVNVRIDFVANTGLLIYSLLEDGRVEEPALMKLHPSEDGKGLYPVFEFIGAVSPDSVFDHHPTNVVLFSYEPVTAMKDAYINQLQQVKENKRVSREREKAVKSGIITPTGAQIDHINRKK